MKHELLEVVDDQGLVLRTAERVEIYARGWRHRGVHVLLFDDHDRLLLQRRSVDKPTWPQRWDLSIAETVAPGEEYLEAAQRGLREELAITSPPSLALVHEKYTHEYHYDSYTVKGLISLYAGRFSGVINLDQEEVSEIQWLDVEQVTELVATQPDDCTPWFLDDWRYTIPRLPNLWKELA